MRTIVEILLLMRYWRRRALKAEDEAARLERANAVLMLRMDDLTLMKPVLLTLERARKLGLSK